jgi:hypothetical protein
MVLQEKDANAQILRIYIDFSTKSNQYFLSNLSQCIPEVIDQTECYGEAKMQINATQGINIVKRNKRIRNIDLAYLIVLASRGYRFRSVMEKIYLCEEKALNPDFEQFTPVKPKISASFEAKTAVLNAIIENLVNSDEEIIDSLVNALPELLEKAIGVHYTGRFLSINEWLQDRENDGEWTSDEIFKYGNRTLTPKIIAHLLLLQIRGWYLQEIPEEFKDNDYIFIKK